MHNFSLLNMLDCGIGWHNVRQTTKICSIYKRFAATLLPMAEQFFGFAFHSIEFFFSKFLAFLWHNISAKENRLRSFCNTKKLNSSILRWFRREMVSVINFRCVSGAVYLNSLARKALIYAAHSNHCTQVALTLASIISVSIVSSTHSFSTTCDTATTFSLKQNSQVFQVKFDEKIKCNRINSKILRHKFTIDA